MPDKDTIRLITQAIDKLKNRLITQRIVMGDFIIYYDPDSDSIKVDYVEE